MVADGRVDERIGNYTKFWQSNLKQETNVEVENRIDDYTNVVNVSRWSDGALRVRLGKVTFPASTRANRLPHLSHDTNTSSPPR